MAVKSAFICFFSLAIVMIFLTSFGYCQNTRETIKQASDIYGVGEIFGNNMVTRNGVAGFSWVGLIGGVLFGSVGFIAFIYGKKNSEFKPLIIGVLLMGYPYLVRNEIAVFAVGVVLTVLLFIQ